MNDLAQMKCVPCQGGNPPLKGKALQPLLKQLETGWKIVHEHHLEREYKFKDFKTTLAFVNKVGAVAEEIGHHPNIEFTWGSAKIRIYTHKIDGLHENDFILAAKIDQILQ
jgi:4a-hydroxytetrahydrobiopterin dehydratase